ncbi:unnamed protein product, partial [Effrenium voratum]
MTAVDAMLGQSSCLNSPSLCAFRCTYDSEKDVCGPIGFCHKVSASEAKSVLAPFGSDQKCKAVGATTHEAADTVLTDAVETVKAMALEVSKKMEEERGDRQVRRRSGLDEAHGGPVAGSRRSLECPRDVAASTGGPGREVHGCGAPRGAGGHEALASRSTGADGVGVRGG